MASQPKNEEEDVESLARVGPRDERGHEPPQVLGFPEQPTAAQVALLQRTITEVVTKVLRNIMIPQAPITPCIERRERSPLERIKKLNVDDFKGEIVNHGFFAEDWLDHTKWCMDYLHLSDEGRLDCVQGLLKEQASRWWDNIVRERRPEEITWALFLEQFENKYISERFKDTQRKLFLSLRQGRMTVPEYESQFIKLVRYARDIVDSEAKRCKQFEDGLNDEIRVCLLAAEIRVFPKLVNAAATIEEIQSKMQRRTAKRSRFH